MFARLFTANNKLLGFFELMHSEQSLIILAMSGSMSRSQPFLLADAREFTADTYKLATVRLWL
jgi:hypothetical protein